MVPLSVTWVRTAVALRVDAVVHVLDVLGGLLAVVRMAKNTMDGGWCLDMEEKWWPSIY